MPPGTFLDEMQIVAGMLDGVAGVDREELHTGVAEQFGELARREAHGVALHDTNTIPLRCQQSLEMGQKHRQRAAARLVHIEVLLVENIDCKAFLAVISQGIQQKQE
jgi:hypothetical protein